MTDDDLDKQFAAIMHDVDLSAVDGEPVKYANLNTIQVLMKFHETKGRLIEAGALFIQESDEEKQLAAEYAALLLELRRRGM